MAMRLFLLYALVELAVMVALASTIGFGWTVLLLLGTFVLGLALAGSQVKRHIRRLQSGLTPPPSQGAATDSVLVALGTVLVVIPGLASSVLGALLLLPPTRAAARPLVTAMAARRMPLITAAARRRGLGIHRGRAAVTTSTARSSTSTDVEPPRRGAQASTAEHDLIVTTLLLNGRVHSPAMPDATAMAVRDGVVAWLGSDDVGREQFPDARDRRPRRRLRRAGVRRQPRPPHRDRALTLVGLDLRAATSLRHCLDARSPTTPARIPTARSGHTAGTSRAGRNAPRPAPTTSTPSSADRPAYLARVDVHSAAASTALRRLAPGPGRRRRVRSAAAADRRRPSPGAGGGPDRADARAARASPASPPSTPRPPSASSPCTNARARRSAASTTGTSCASSTTASRSSATGVSR